MLVFRLQKYNKITRKTDKDFLPRHSEDSKKLT